jgi:Tfp pilus assembly protein PilN
MSTVPSKRAAMEQQINLYQPILGAEKRLFSARAIGLTLLLLTTSLAGFAGFAAWRNARLERTITLLEQQQAAEIAMADRVSAAIKPTTSFAELEVNAKRLSAEIASRERALDIVRRGSANSVSGFGARLEALARSQLEGLWLSRIVVSVGDGQLAFRGAATDARFIPTYLAALSGEPALNGVRFDRIAMHRAKADEAPAQTVFEIGAPGLSFTSEEDFKREDGPK